MGGAGRQRLTAYTGRGEQHVEVHLGVLGLLLGDEPEQLRGRLVLGGQQAGAAHDVLEELNRQALELLVLVEVLRARAGIQSYGKKLLLN